MALDRPKFRIVTRGLKTEIYVDGEKMKGVRSISFEKHQPDQLPILNIGFVALDLEIDTDSLPCLPEPYFTWYEREKLHLKEYNS